MLTRFIVVRRNTTSTTMTAFPDRTFFQEKNTSDLARAISETTQKLEEARQERLRVEEETARCKKETEQRMKFMMENGAIGNALHQLGKLLSEEKHLSEHLDQRAASHRNKISILEEQLKSASSKVQSLTAEILEVEERLAELKACDSAGQASSPVATRKSKRKTRKK